MSDTNGIEFNEDLAFVIEHLERKNRGYQEAAEFLRDIDYSYYEFWQGQDEKEPKFFRYLNLTWGDRRLMHLIFQRGPELMSEIADEAREERTSANRSMRLEEKLDELFPGDKNPYYDEWKTRYKHEPPGKKRLL